MSKVSIRKKDKVIIDDFIDRGLFKNEKYVIKYAIRALQSEFVNKQDSSGYYDSHISDAIEGLMVCFGFTSIEEIRAQAMARLNRNDDYSFKILLNQLSNEAIQNANPSFHDVEFIENALENPKPAPKWLLRSLKEHLRRFYKK